MIRHILLFSFNETITEIDILRIKSSFLTIPERIPGIISVEWGENNSPENKNQGFSHCINMVFNNHFSRDSYLVHQEHVSLQELFRPFISDIIVFDYICYL